MRNSPYTRPPEITKEIRMFQSELTSWTWLTEKTYVSHRLLRAKEMISKYCETQHPTNVFTILALTVSE